MPHIRSVASDDDQGEPAESHLPYSSALCMLSIAAAASSLASNSTKPKPLCFPEVLSKGMLTSCPAKLRSYERPTERACVRHMMKFVQTLISPKGMKTECRTASFTFSSKPPTYNVSLGFVPFPDTTTVVLCMINRESSYEFKTIDNQQSYGTRHNGSRYHFLVALLKASLLYDHDCNRCRRQGGTTVHLIGPHGVLALVDQRSAGISLSRKRCHWFSVVEQEVPQDDVVL